MERFTVTAEHIALIQRFNVFYDRSKYDGAPAIDSKRPYGNMDMIGDIAEILGIEKTEGDEEIYWPKGATARCLALHKETAKALQIVLRTKSFEPGVYVSDDYMDNWRRE